MCERLSGINNLRNETPKTDQDRYRFIHEIQSTFTNKNKVEFLNLSDLKYITNKSLKSIAYNLFNNLKDLCIWGDYLITDDGFLHLCTVNNSNLKRINYCGCYKISEDSRLWISSNISRVLTYI